MKKLKKIMFILISISLFKTTAFATKENPNKINIIEDEKLDKDEKIKNVYNNIKYDILKNTKTLNMKNSKNINNTENIPLFNPKNKLIFNKNLETDINLNKDKKEENPNKINIIEEEKSEKLENNGDKINIINEIKNKD